MSTYPKHIYAQSMFWGKLDYLATVFDQEEERRVKQDFERRYARAMRKPDRKRKR